MNKPQGISIIKIESLVKPDNTIEHYHIEVFDKNPLKGLPRKYKPQAGDRLFIYPDSNIPRFKLKNFCEKHKVSIAKAKETATVFFMDPETANKDNKYFYHDYYPHMIYKQYFTDYVKKASRVGDKRYIKLLADLEASQEDAVYLCDYYTFEQHGLNKYKLDIVRADDTEGTDDQGNDITLVPNCKERNKIYFIEADAQKKAFAEIENKNVYHSDALLALLNEGSVVDKEMYDGIMNLFKSADEKDHRVAMEAMANCDYEKSAVYLLMVFYHNQNDINNSDTKSHVNFKSYLKFFNLQPGRGISIDDIVDRLKDKRLLNSSNLAIVMKEAKKIMQETVESDTEYFMFTDVAPVEEIQKEVAETDAEEAAQAIQQAPPAPVVPILDPMGATTLTDL